MDFDFDAAKDQWLKSVRGIGFEDIITLIKEGKLVDVVEHPNPIKYPDQMIFVVDVDGYVYLVPFELRQEVFYLRTIYASRKATKTYLNKKDEP